MIVQHLHHHTSYQQTTGTPLITNDDNIADPTYFQAKETPQHFGKIVGFLPNSEDKVRAAKVLLASKSAVNRTLNLLYPH